MSADSAPTLELSRYLARVGVAGPLAPDRATLARLHRAHLAAIPFENLDVRLGRPVGLDLASLEAQLVARRRGGYCFQQNSLFAAALRAVGFSVATLEARVRPPGAPAQLPRTHMLLRVELPAGGWLADVGFGGDGPLDPVPLDGTASEQPGDAFRVVTEAGGTIALQRRGEAGWADLYAFRPEPALPVDFQVAHHFTSTFPRSPFVTTLTVQRATPAARETLRGRTLTVRRGAEVESRELADEEVVAAVRERFGLDVTAEDVLAALPTPA